jgi:Phage tail assembly chaperone protein
VTALHKIVDGIEVPLTDEEIAELEAQQAEAPLYQWEFVRAERNAKLAACDWTQLPDSPISNVAAQEWAAYRQALRDITTQEDPFNITWPEEPAV